MIKKRNMSAGVNANLSLEPSSASAANSNINNNIYITRKVASDSEVVKELENEKDDVI